MRLAAYLFTVFASSGRELEVGVGREMEELDFSSIRFLTESMFSSIILVREDLEWLERRKVTEDYKSVENSGEDVTARKLTW